MTWGEFFICMIIYIIISRCIYYVLFYFSCKEYKTLSLKYTSFDEWYYSDVLENEHDKNKLVAIGWGLVPIIFLLRFILYIHMFILLSIKKYIKKLTNIDD